MTEDESWIFLKARHGVDITRTTRLVGDVLHHIAGAQPFRLYMKNVTDQAFVVVLSDLHKSSGRIPVVRFSFTLHGSNTRYFDSRLDRRKGRENDAKIQLIFFLKSSRDNETNAPTADVDVGMLR
jgi:hypothetical protein